VKRSELEKKVQRAAKSANVSCVFYELARHRGVQVGATATTIPRHAEVPNRLAEAIFKQLEPELGERWWR
jgi:hypothetical protein